MGWAKIPKLYSKRPATVHKLRCSHPGLTSSPARTRPVLGSRSFFFTMAAVPFEKDSASMFSTDSDPSTWRYVDEHQTSLSFTRVVPVNVRVHDLEVSVKTQAQRQLPWQSKTPSTMPGDAEAGTASWQKTIITGISADFPAGSLSAIIAGSGSGKVSRIVI